MKGRQGPWNEGRAGHIILALPTVSAEVTGAQCAKKETENTPDKKFLKLECLVMCVGLLE